MGTRKVEAPLCAREEPRRPAAAMAYPSLTGLGLKTETYKDSDLAWMDRQELVQGGCKRDTDCYEQWRRALQQRVLDATRVQSGCSHANTIVLLSVGAGVAELHALQLIVCAMHSEAKADGHVHAPLKSIVLVDPGMPQEKANQVASHFAAHLEDVDVDYFCGDDAYRLATQWTNNAPRGAVAAIGALNVHFGLISEHADHKEAHRQVLALVASAAEENPGLHVVTAFENPPRPFVLRDESACEFVMNELRMLEGHLETMRKMSDRAAASSV